MISSKFISKTPTSTIFLLLLIFTLQTASQDSCSEGCLICSSSGNCSLCDVENSYSLNSSSQCEKQTLANCLLSFSVGDCEICQSPFYSKSGECTEVPTDKQIKGCIVYASESTCSTCNDEHFLKSGKCEALTVERKVTDCLEYTDSGCQTCLSGFPNYLQDQCDVWDDMDLNCGFYYKGQKCLSCEDGYQMNYSILSASTESVYTKIFRQNLLFGKEKIGGLPQNLCSAGDSNQIKVSCEDGLTLSEGCVRCDSSTSYFDYNQRKCLPNPEVKVVENTYKIDNCLSLNLNFECVLCYNGFFLHYTKKKCLAHQTMVDKCLVMSQGIDSVCLLCEQTHYLQTNSNSCTLRTHTIENCQEYNFFKDECNICASGFSLQVNNTKCLEIPENCVEPVAGSTSPLTCSKCIADLHLFGGICEEIPAEKKVDFCDSYSKSSQTDQDGNQTTVFTCTGCTSDYTLVQNKFLLSANHTNFPEFTAPSTVDDPDKRICVLTSQFYRDVAGCSEFIDGQCLLCNGDGQLYSVLNSCQPYSQSNPKFIEGCNVYKADGTCEQCIYSYKNESDGKCYTSSATNCRLFKSSQVLTETPRCILCDEGYALHDGHCYSLKSVEPDISNCLLYDTRGRCIYCATGYVNHYSSSQTQGQSKSHKCFDRRIFLSHLNADKILGCDSFEEKDGGGIQCFSCIHGYELDKNNLCVPCLPHFIKSNQVDSFVFDKTSSTFYCKNDFSPTNEDCLYYSDETFFKCLVYRQGIAGSHLVDELNNRFNFSELPLLVMSPFGDLKGANWRASRPTKISQFPYRNTRKKTLTNPKSHLKHYLFQNNTDYVNDSILGAVCQLGYARNFSGLSLQADDCISFVKNCDIRARVFYPGKTGIMISCSRCFQQDSSVYYTTSMINKNLLTDIDKHIQKGYATANLPSTFCYPNTLPNAVSNCGVYELEPDNASYNQFCRACKPGYKPTYNLSSPTEVTACTKIDHCQFSSVANICELCDSGYGFVQNSNSDFARQTCNILLGQVQYCLEWNGDQNAPACSHCRPGYHSPSELCPKSIYGDCSHFDDQGNCLKCEGINQIAFITNVIKEVNSGCLLGTYTRLPFCETQYTENKCFKCYDSFILNSEGRCFSKHKVFNCAEYDTVSEQCILCLENFTLDFNFQRCVPQFSYSQMPSELDTSQGQLCSGQSNHISFSHLWSVNKGLHFSCGSIGIENCEIMDQAKLTSARQLECTKCRNSFEITASTSVQKCLSFEPLKNCKAQAFDAQLNLRCTECKQGYYLGVDGQCLLRNNMPKCLIYFANFDACKECESAFFLDVADNHTCKQRLNLDDKCAEYFKFKDSCKVYNSKYQYISQRLYDLTRSPPSNAPETTENQQVSTSDGGGIPGCTIYSAGHICRECDSNTYLYLNECKAVPEKVTNCKLYSSKTDCSRCDSGYLLQENQCKLILALNCLVYENENKCRSCTFEHPYLDTDFNCKKNPSVPNCKYYSTVSKCKECDASYHLTNEFKCIQLQTTTANCDQYNSSGACAVCKKGYQLETENSQTSCVQTVGVDPFCANAVSTGNRCAVCKSGYVLVDGECQKCDHLNPGCAVCDPLARNVCLMCASGYSMDTQAKCQQNQAVFDSYIKLSYDI